MASTGLDFNNITPNNGAITELSELLFEEVLKSQKLDDLFNILTGERDGKKVGFVGDFGALGLPSSGCTPEYGNDLINTAEKTWSIGEWVIAEKICFADLKATLVRNSMRNGTAIADLTDTDYLAEIIYPKLLKAIADMLFRVAMFGDTNADTVTNGGVITDTANPDLFKITDGFWKQIVAAVTAGDAKRVTIAANSSATYQDQIDDLYTPGVATAIMDSIITDAPLELRGANGQIIITQSLADALSVDVRQNNKGSELQWKSIFEGIATTMYSGVPVVVVPQMDKNIRTFEDNGTTWNLPHRAIYTTKTNLLLGFENTTSLAQIDIFFDKRDQMNYVVARDSVGALLAQDDLVCVAY